MAVYCGAATGNDPAFKEETVLLGEWLVANDYDLIYGGGGVGLMGILAETVLTKGGKAYGIMPQNLVERGAAYEGLTNLQVVPNMSIRKQEMLNQADVCIALPGGPGTLEEIIEAFSWARLGDNSNPCLFFNVKDYYTPLQGFLKAMTDKGFLTVTDFDKIGFIEHLDELAPFIAAYTPPRVRQYEH